MTKIQHNLKDVRISKGYTQEEVANKIGLTRQAISSYESGRTQPGIDMLMKLSEVYGVELEDILYGDSNCKNNLKIKKVVILLTSLYWLMFILRGIMRIIAHRCFPITTGYMEQNYEIYFALTNVANIIQYTIAKYYFPIALLAIFYLNVSLKNTISYKTKIKYILYYIIISIAIDGMIQILDPLYLQYFYIVPLLWKLIPIGIALAIDLIIKYFQTKRRSN